MKKTLLFILFAIYLFTLSAVEGLVATSANANSVCQPQYGGGQTCLPTGNILVNKTVKDPVSGNFVDNLSINDAKFAPEQVVQFRITVTNVGNTSLSNISVKDIFPEFVKFISGVGTFDDASNSLNINVDNLNGNESKTFEIAVQVTTKDRLPNDKGIVCATNQAIASISGIQKSDNSEFCIQKQEQVTKGGLKVLTPVEVKKTPATGPEMLSLIALIPSGILGLFLRRKSNKKI